MLPILLIHGYSSEGKDRPVEEIYGTLPADLAAEFGADAVRQIDLSRWISLDDGITLDDVSFAMDRALQTSPYRDLLESGFHVVIHSTGALVVRNWIRLYAARPCPIVNLVHLAGAQFGSGLAHIGRGQMARWSKLIVQGVGRGVQVLNELEFGATKTLDLQLHFRQSGYDMYTDYQVQEYCLVGSQTLNALKAVPIRYVKEDSADNTVRTSAANLNFNYLSVKPSAAALKATRAQVRQLLAVRREDQRIDDHWYSVALNGLAENRPQVPFSVLYETAHFGADLGIVSGERNRKRVVPLIVSALRTPYDKAAYQQCAELFASNHDRTFQRVARLKASVLSWNKQAQYEGHAQLIFRVRDQFGNDVPHHDITFRSRGTARRARIEHMIEDKHANETNPGTVTFYLRTQQFDQGHWTDLLNIAAPVDVEITGHEPDTDEITYVPLTVSLSRSAVAKVIQSFRTTVVDVTLARLPGRKVFQISSSV